MNVNSELQEEIEVYERYYKSRLINKKSKTKGVYDPVITFYKMISDENYRVDSLSSFIQKEVEPEYARESIALYLHLTDKISVESLEFVRVFVTTRSKNITKETYKNIRTKIFRIYAKVAYQFPNELKLFIRNQKSKNFPEIIWQYFNFFFMYFSSLKPGGFNRFEILSKPVFRILAQEFRTILQTGKNPAPISFLWDIFPTLFNLIIKEAGTQHTTIFEFLKFCVNTFIAEFYQDFYERFDIISSTFYTFTAIYSNCTPAQKEIISNCVASTCFLFTKADLPNESSIINMGYTCFEFNIKNHDVNFNKIVTSCVSFLRWACDKCIIKNIVIPKIDPNASIVSEIQSKPCKFLSLSEFKEHMNLSRRFSEPTSISVIREFSEQNPGLYSAILLLRERVIGSPELSQILCNDIMNQLREIKNTDIYHSFLCISLVLIHPINEFCLKEAIKNDWSIIVDRQLFCTQVDPNNKDRIAVFIKQMQDYIIYFLSERCKKGHNIFNLVFQSLSSKLTEYGDFFVMNIFPVFEYLLNDIPDIFIPAYLNSFAFQYATTYISKSPQTLLSYKLFSFLQALTITSPESILDMQVYTDLCLRLVILANYQDVVKSMFFSLIRDNNTIGMVRFTSFVALLLEQAMKNVESYGQIAITFVHAMNNNMAALNHPDIGNVIKTSIIYNAAQLPQVTGNPNDVKLVLSLIKNIFYTYPMFTEYLIPRSARLATTLSQTVSQVDLDSQILDELTSILFGVNSKFREIKTIRIYGIMSVLMNSIKGKPEELSVLEWIYDLERTSRLNALLCCDGGLMSICLGRLSHLQQNEKNLTSIILNIVTSLFEQFPSTSFMLQLLPAMKASIQSEEKVWPLYVLSFLKRLSAEQEILCEPSYVALSFPETYIKIPDSSLPDNIFNMDWTFVTTIRLSSNSVKGSAFPLLYIGDNNESFLVLIKDNLLSLSIKSTKSHSMQIFNFNFENDCWFHVELAFGMNEISLYVDFQKIETQKRTLSQLPKPMHFLIGSYNDSKIVKKSYADISNTYIFSGLTVAKINPRTEFNTVDFTNSIVCFNIANTTKHYGNIPANSPYIDTANLRGFFVPPPVSFSTLFTNDIVWNSFIVVYFGATMAIGSDFGVEDPLVLLPIIMENIISSSVECEKCFDGMNGFSEISSNFTKLNRHLDESIFVSLFKLLKCLKLDKSKINCIKFLWMNPKLHKVITKEAVTFCINVLTEVSVNEPQIIMEVLGQPFVVEFINQLIPNNKVIDKIPDYVQSLIHIFFKLIQEKGQENHVSVLMDTLMSSAHNDIKAEALNASLKMMMHNSKSIVVVLKQLGFATPFLQLMHNKDPKIHLSALKCFKNGAEITNVSDEEIMVSILRLTESMDELQFDASDIFLDSFEYMFKNKTDNVDVPRRRSSANDKPLPMKSHYFFPLFAAASTTTERDIVKQSISDLTKSLITYPDACSCMTSIPFWPYWIIILCQSGLDSSEVLKSFREIANCILLSSFKSGNFTPVKQALSMLDTVSFYLKVDLLECKSAILYSAAQSFKDGRESSESFKAFAASVFQLIFVRPIVKFDRRIELRSNPFRLVALEKERSNISKIKGSDLSFHMLMDEENKPKDLELMKSALDALEKWIQISHREVIIDDLLYNVNMYSYLVCILMQRMPETAEELALRFIASYDFIPNTGDTEEEHSALGIFLFIANKMGFNWDKVKTLNEKFNFFNDDEDSPELQKYLFEEQINQNLSKLFLVNFV
ncbi:hypothetical protein TVAG_357510 [Trichomonas vaginalis G3]|uniref:Uncharacterized protein n=1 Tax=Trichomonas vaginalis (strain ATCC PRA-98 / G3) TaxID=412133 RepID=A2F9Q2_TRIV3|nr:platelet formation protein family [Trichomonas vaginalis G3]EAX98382.1 hypothetical protein TVAG_357510 [Trichomonas vaginalis G3]KAI5536636.1 platelet formation protein family [Trichomonas vaginalis G3]|eukprot:XP_001311312.1 hypothetical protein [Trichomonas vaginalis G3]